MLRKLRNIILGTYYNVFGKKDDVARPRLQICGKCPDKAKVYGLGFVCKHCGCVLKSKAAVRNERCPLGKW